VTDFVIPSNLDLSLPSLFFPPFNSQVPCSDQVRVPGDHAESVRGSHSLHWRMFGAVQHYRNILPSGKFGKSLISHTPSLSMYQCTPPPPPPPHHHHHRHTHTHTHTHTHKHLHTHSLPVTRCISVHPHLHILSSPHAQLSATPPHPHPTHRRITHCVTHVNLQPPPATLLQTGEDVLDFFDMNELTMAGNALCLLAYGIITRIFAYLILVRNVPKRVRI
jgi:hypothetical protein